MITLWGGDWGTAAEGHTTKKKRELAFRHKHFCLLGLHPWPTCCGGCSVTSRVQLFSTSWTVACQVPLSSIIYQNLLNFMSTEPVTPSNHLILCFPLVLLPSIFPSIRVFFQRVGSLHQVAKVLELQLQCQSFQWIFRTDFFRMDWLDLLAVQGTLKSLLQHHNLRASVLRLSGFFMVQLSHLYVTIGKTIPLTIQICAVISCKLLK